MMFTSELYELTYLIENSYKSLMNRVGLTKGEKGLIAMKLVQRAKDGCP